MALLTTATPAVETDDTHSYRYATLTPDRSCGGKDYCNISPNKYTSSDPNRDTEANCDVTTIPTSTLTHSDEATADGNSNSTATTLGRRCKFVEEGDKEVILREALANLGDYGAGNELPSFISDIDWMKQNGANFVSILLEFWTTG